MCDPALSFGYEGMTHYIILSYYSIIIIISIISISIININHDHVLFITYTTSFMSPISTPFLGFEQNENLQPQTHLATHTPTTYMNLHVYTSSSSLGLAS